MTPRALILVDIQYDFLPPSGALAVPGGDAILEQVYTLLDDAERYDVIVASMDCELALYHEAYTCECQPLDHPEGHISFASTHSKEPFIEITVPKLNTQGDTITQMLWPDHCVQNTDGCKIEAGVQSRLDTLGSDKVKYIRKGTHKDVDAYSAFSDNAYTMFTPLARILHEHRIEQVDIVGLALDYCVKFTAIDARKFNFATRLLRGATRAVDAGNEQHVLRDLECWGVEIKD